MTARVARAQREWFSDSVTGSSAAVFNVAAIQDPEDALSRSIRVLRMIGCWNGSGSGLTVTNDCFFGLGVLLVNQNDTTLYDPFAAADADKPWLYRSMWPIPVQAAPVVAASGMDLRFDWQLRGGKGTTVKHDNQLQLCAAVKGVTAGTFNFAIRWWTLTTE